MFNLQEVQLALFQAFTCGMIFGAVVVLVRYTVLSPAERKTP